MSEKKNPLRNASLWIGILAGLTVVASFSGSVFWKAASLHSGFNQMQEKIAAISADINSVVVMADQGRIRIEADLKAAEEAYRKRFNLHEQRLTTLTVGHAELKQRVLSVEQGVVHNTELIEDILKKD